MAWNSFLRRSPVRGNAKNLYQKVVAQARDPYFYTDFGISDTVDGRFDLIVLHMFLVISRLSGQGPEAKKMGQALFDVMIVNLDEALREMGVGDLSVGKKIKKMAKAFYGRMDAYQRAIEDGTENALSSAIGRNLFRGQKADGADIALAVYVMRQLEALQGQSLERILLGLIDFETVEAHDRLVATAE